MIRIQEELQKLTLILPEFRQAIVSSAVEPEMYLRGLSRAIEVLEAKIEKSAFPKPPLDPEVIWTKWSKLGFDLSRLDDRELRTLCVSPVTAMRQRLVAELAKSPEPLKRWINLNGFVQAYFAHWRTMEQPEDVEKLIHFMLAGDRVPRKGKTLSLWRSSLFLFSPQAAQRLGEIMTRDHSSIKQTCTDYLIDHSSAMAQQVHEAAAESAAREFVKRGTGSGEPAACKELQWMAENLLTPNLSAVVYRRALGSLVMSKSADDMPLVRKMLVGLILTDERLGDPRLANCARNWRTVPEESKERFFSWLAQETLQFFFETLVPVNDENRRRADFWLKYANTHGKIKDFQVAVSDQDRPKIRASRAKTIPTYSEVNGGHTSAFLMVFEGYGTEYVVIEFSETGNAAYIYERKVFERSGARLRSNSFHLNEDLKRMRDKKDRILHSAGGERWEVGARRKLAELGIRQ